VYYVIVTTISLASLTLAFIAYRQQSKRVLKRMHYTANGCKFILWENRDVEVHMQGHPLIFPNLYLLRIQNTGGAPIIPSDFSSPLKLHFGTTAKIIYGVIRFNRPDLLGEMPKLVKSYNGDIFIEPFLINPRDRIDIIMVVDGILTEPSVQARIAGVEELVFLPPLDPNIKMKLIERSLLFKTRAEWPQPGVHDPTIFVIPILVDPAKDLHKSFDVLVGVKNVPNAHAFVVCFKSCASKRIDKKDVDKPLILEWPETLVGDVSVSIGDVELDSSELCRFVTWDEHQVAICPAPLKFDQDLVINVITSGPGEDLRATQVPRLVSDVHIARINLEDFIENNLVKIKPEVLLSNYTAHTLWQKITASLWPTRD
jgi:hypothetical protein